ncbi:MAG: acetyltransferase [Streptomyces sp.]|uniref:GNAT family N-acetyltransferase n=1 Tax=Streptomyces sp. TaxID=1931 RepID=UPI0025DB90EE|nr:GNAT family N-acetyltransferase [Streptomyces sp.]MBW8796768.1 acetyltransferase [Streptomyces sp.]
MPPTDASADTGPVPAHPRPAGHPGRSGTAEDVRDCEDTLDLRLPGELLALIAGTTPEADEPAAGLTHERRGPLDPPGPPDLLDQVGTWGPTETPVGLFHLLPVHVARDLPVISGWMNDPAVAAFWQLAGSGARTEDHLRAQLAGDGRSVPCLGVLDGTPMSYWEIYRADLDPLARHYPARPHDTGVHLLVGDAADRGRGLGSALLRAVADLVLDRRPACARVVAEPDLHNTPSVAAFLNAGFRYASEVDLPGKRAALMIRDRSLRHLM